MTIQDESISKCVLVHRHLARLCSSENNVRCFLRANVRCPKSIKFLSFSFGVDLLGSISMQTESDLGLGEGLQPGNPQPSQLLQEAFDIIPDSCMQSISNIISSIS